MIEFSPNLMQNVDGVVNRTKVVGGWGQLLFLKIWRYKCQNSNFGRLKVFLCSANYWNSNDLISYLFVSISTYFMCINLLYYILYVYMYIVTFSITLFNGSYHSTIWVKFKTIKM